MVEFHSRTCTMPVNPSVQYHRLNNGDGYVDAQVRINIFYSDMDDITLCCRDMDFIFKW